MAHHLPQGFDRCGHPADLIAPLGVRHGLVGLAGGDRLNDAGQPLDRTRQHADHDDAKADHQQGDRADHHHDVVRCLPARRQRGVGCRPLSIRGGLSELLERGSHGLTGGFNIGAGHLVQLPGHGDQVAGGPGDRLSDVVHHTGVGLDGVRRGAGQDGGHVGGCLSRRVAHVVGGRSGAGGHEHHRGGLNPAHGQAISVYRFGGRVQLVHLCCLHGGIAHRTDAAVQRAAPGEFAHQRGQGDFEQGACLEQPFLAGGQQVGAECGCLCDGAHQGIELGQGIIQQRLVRAGFRLMHQRGAEFGLLRCPAQCRADAGDGLLDLQFAADDAEFLRRQQAALDLMFDCRLRRDIFLHCGHETQPVQREQGYAGQQRKRADNGHREFETDRQVANEVHRRVEPSHLSSPWRTGRPY